MVEGSRGGLEARAARITGMVSAARQRLVAAALLTGLCLALLVAIAWVVGGVLLDLAAPLPVPLRAIVFAGWWLAVAAAAAVFVFLPALRRPLLEGVALRIERLLGGIQNRLLTVVDLHRGGAATRGWHDDPARQSMAERLVAQTEQRLFGFSPASVVRWRAVLRGAGLAAVALGLLALLWGVLGERFTTTLARLLDPTADIPPATWARLEAPGDVEVLEGEPLELAALVTRGTVESADLVIEGADGTRRREPMRPDGAARHVALLDGLEHDARYRVEGGGTWTRAAAIRVLRRPAIGATTASIRLPDYMRIEEPLGVAPEAARIEAPLGSSVDLRALVAGDPVRGVIRLLDRGLETTLVERFDERVWFDDDLPRDAVAGGGWKWTTAQAAGGLRSFTFAADGRPLEMRTRLEPLVLPKEGLDTRFFTIMVRADPGDAPHLLAVELAHDGGAVELLWGDEGAGPAADLRVPRVVVGPLPEAGRWERLTVALDRVPQVVGRAVESMKVTIDRGRMLLDRPGWTERSMKPVEHPVDRPIGEIAARREDPGADAGVGKGTGWIATVPVGDARREAGTAGAGVPGGDTRPVWATLEFVNAQGHPSRAAAAVEIVGTTDRPPSLVVEEPQSELLQLSSLDDVRVVAHLFDDWGIDQVAVRVGADEASLGEPVPLVEAALPRSPPDTMALLETVLSADRLGLSTGSQGSFVLAIRDTKGQWSESRSFRVVVVPGDAPAPEPAQVPALEEALRRAREAARQADTDRDLLDRKREEVLAAIGRPALEAIDRAEEAAAKRDRAAEEGARLRDDPDATPETKSAAEQAMQGAAESVRSVTAEAQTTADTAAAALSERMKEDFATLDRFLDERRQDAASLAAALENAAKQATGAQGVRPEQARTLGEAARAAADLGKRLEASPQFQADAARVDRLADAPTPSEVASMLAEIGRQTQGVATQLEAEATSRRIDSLADDLARRAEGLERLGEERDDLATREGRQPARPAQAALDRQGREQARQVDEIVGPDRERAEPPPADPSDPLAAIMEQSRETARAAAEAAARIADELATQAPVGSPEQAADAPSAQPDQQGQRGQPGQGQQGQGQRGQQGQGEQGTPKALSPEQLRAMLQSPEVQSTLRMAERAQRLSARESRRAAERLAQAQAAASQQQGQGEGQPGATPGTDPTQAPTDGGAQAGQAAVKEADLRGLDAARRAAIYKLPPRVRDPLLEGMRERGPAAYQEVIDTYFRHLGRDLPP